ncbi:MAG: hypothetical protein LQ348_007128 [Seirophora lacunosa]|nr:MAG: hypothetical protein LQ348_007128 [Seirophora lacunosa]
MRILPVAEDLPISDLPKKPVSEDQVGKYVLHDEGDELYTITRNGVVIRKTQHFSESQEYIEESVKEEIVKPYISLEWADFHDRKDGAIDGKPTVAFNTYIDHTFEDMEEEFEAYQQGWDSSDAAIALKEQLAGITKQHHLTKVVSFGTGSLQEHCDAQRRRTHLQIAALLMITACINDGRAERDRARLYSQEPAYTDLDKQFLRSLGVETADDPEGFELMDSSTVFCDWATFDYVMRKVSQGPWPAVLISMAVKMIDSRPPPFFPGSRMGSSALSQAEAQGIVDMAKGCSRQAFPFFPDEDTFDGYIIYTRNV